MFYLQPRDLSIETILNKGKNNKVLPARLAQRCLKAAFDSSRTYGLFSTYFDDELYHYAADKFNQNTSNSSTFTYPILGIARVLEDVEISQRNRPKYRDVQRLIEEDFAKINDEAQFIRKFAVYLNCKVILQLMQGDREDLELLSVSDDKAKAFIPGWWQRAGGICYQINSYVGSLNLVAKANRDGKFKMQLAGSWVPQQIPYWIDYTKLTINDAIIFDKRTPAWDRKPYVYDMDVKAGEEVKIQVEWLPHQSNT